MRKINNSSVIFGLIVGWVRPIFALAKIGRNPSRATLLFLILALCGCNTANYFQRSAKTPALQAIEQKVAMHTRWKQKVGSGSNGHYLALTPALGNGVLYAADAKGVIEAIEIKSGKTQWRNKLKEPITGGVGLGLDMVLVGTRKGEVIALTQDKGANLWRTEVDGEIVGSPVVNVQAVVVQTSNNRVIGLDPETGKIAWTFESATPALTLRSASQPVLSGKVGVVGQPNGRLVAFDLRTGERQWEQTLVVGRGRSELQRMVDINGDLAVVNGVLYAASYQGRIGAFDISNGRLFWQRDMSSNTGVTIVDDNTLAVSDTDGIVWLINSDTGATLWKQEALKERRLTRPTVVNDKLVVSDHQGLVHVLRLDDGKLVARDKLGSKPIYAPAISNDEAFFILDSAGKLEAYQMS